jgi:hypothetical protein
MSTKVAASFKTSINIKFDLGKKEFINRYLPTPSHAESLIGLLKGFNDPINNKRSHIIIGPYGTGKSLIATIVGNLISKKINDFKTLNTLSKKFNKVHDDIYVEIQKVRELEKRYIPVVLNGYEGRFRDAIINAIIRTFKEQNINIMLPGQYGKIIQTIELWESEYPKTFKQFKKLLKEKNKDLELWRISILNQDKDEVDWFHTIYPLLTSGAKFTPEINESFIDQISNVLEQLNQQNLGLFIAYDEFGRFLQSLEMNEINETMQDLQDLAELADHHCENLHLLLISHRNLRHYFRVFTDDLKNEFQRIEKRFRVYHVESDKSTFIRLADNFIQSFINKKSANEEDIGLIKQYLIKYPLFPELNHQEIDKIILEGIYPIHPVTLFLLPYLSNIFGQNERTLFTFLESNETGGLFYHLKNKDSYYLASDLFTYFFPNIYDIDTRDNEQSILRHYKSIITKTPNLEENTSKIRLIRFITLWQLAGLQSKIKLDSDFLCFALNMNREEMSLLLKELSLLKVIRYHHVHGYWELFEASSYQIEQLIEEKIANNIITKNSKLTLIEECFSKQYFFSNEYNDQKSITRYARVKFLTSEDILVNEIDWKKKREKLNSDAVLYYVLIESKSEINKIINIIKSVEDELSIFCISKIPYSAIEYNLEEISAINSLLKETELLNQDKNLEQELLLKREDNYFVINEFLSKFLTYGNDVVWVHNGQIIDIKSEIVLENLLSSIMFKVFPRTPEVRNDSFNRKRINNVQRKAGQAVLDKLINNYTQEDLGINGKGPDYLIYATVFKNNNLNPAKLDELKSKDLQSLRNALLKHVKQNTSGKLSDFVKIMKEPPFGIREPLMPIFLITLLRDKWDQIMFYRNDLFVSGINGEKLYKMLEEASEYNYVFYNFDSQYHEFFNILEEYFGEYQNELVKNKPIVIRLNNSLLSWLRHLPRITQITSQVDKELIWFKETLRRSEINPQQTLTQLFEKYGKNDCKSLLLHKQELENYYNKFKTNLEKKIFEILSTNGLDDLFRWAENQSPEIKKDNNLVKSILKSIDTSDDWLDSFVNAYIGIEIKNWSDTTYDLFKKQINTDYYATFVESKCSDDYYQIQYNGKVKAVKKVRISSKSETIYKNVHRMIKNAGRNVMKEEIENIILKLVDDFIE